MEGTPLQQALFALGLVLAVEGFLYALFPQTMRRMIEQVLRAGTEETRIAALLAAALGVALIALSRS